MPTSTTTNIPLCNTSRLSKMFHTTTTDIENKLKRLGFAPVRTVVQQSGRRFMLWDEQACIKALQELQREKREKLDGQLAESRDLVTRSMTLVASEAPSFEDEIPEIVGNRELLLEIRALRRELSEFMTKDSAPE